MIRTAEDSRADIVVYNRDSVSEIQLRPFGNVKNIRIVPGSIERVQFLLAYHEKVVQLFSDGIDPRQEISKSISLPKRLKLYRQIETAEDGVLTAALLDIQYGDRYNIFKVEDGVHVLVDTAMLGFIKEYLAHELISQAA